jgi:hypothetical protein
MRDRKICLMVSELNCIKHYYFPKKKETRHNCSGNTVVFSLTHQNYTPQYFFLICIVGGGVQTGSTRHVGHLLAYCTCPG